MGLRGEGRRRQDRLMDPQPRCRTTGIGRLAEMVCKLSALRGEADMRDRVTSISSIAIDPKRS